MQTRGTGQSLMLTRSTILRSHDSAHKRAAVISSAECYRHAIEVARLARLAKTRAERRALWGMSRSWETLGKYALQYEEATSEGTRDQ
jgi:hypothetical protein